MAILENAKPIRGNGAHFAAFVARFESCAVVQVYRREEDGVGIDFSAEVASYETATAGATASARAEVKRLEREDLLARIRAKRMAG